MTILSQSDDRAHKLMPRVHRVASLLKRWLLGTHQGAVSEKHLDYYLDEFTFRFNRRRSRARGLLFYRLLQNAVQVDPVSLRRDPESCLGSTRGAGPAIDRPRSMSARRETAAALTARMPSRPAINCRALPLGR